MSNEGLYTLVKRVTDVVVSVAALLLLSPIFALTALLVAVSMGRPVLFVQERPGRHGRLFRLVKFRTMRQGTGTNAERLTPVGRLLRRLSVDELPEFWHVLTGDMSLVGPRPLLPQYLRLYTPEQARRHDAMPGLTGWAQVNGRNAISWERRLALDAWYVEHRSVWLDARILLLTPWKVLTREGARPRDRATMERFEGTKASSAQLPLGPNRPERILPGAGLGGRTMRGSLRERGFWLIDRLRGGPIRRHYDDIAYLTSHPDELARSSDARLRDLIRHATMYVPYYGRFRGAESLADFPVLQKKEIRQHYDSFFSSRYQSRTLPRVSTSGSYGTPMTFALSPDRHSRKMAELIFYSEWAGFHVGARHASIGSRSKHALVALIQNEVPMLARVVDDKWLGRQLDRLRSDRVRAVIGHASVLGLLAKHSRHTGHAACEYSLESAIATAELLTDDVRAAVESAFGCRVLSRYAAHELGVIAHECPHCGQYHLNTPSLSIELLALDDDRPAETGTLGRVVVTDLFSHVMPLIRYDTGDVATLAEPATHACPFRTPALARIEGRRAELVYTTRGEPVHPLTILDAIGEIANGQVKQFQFVQQDRRGYSITVVALSAFNGALSLVDRMKGMLGSDADVSVCCVAEIPPLGSGKRPCIVNNYTRRGQ